MDLRLIGYAVLAFSLFSSGWVAKGWKDDSEKLAVQEVSEAIEKSVSKSLEDKLSKLSTTERTIIREIPKIIDRPVYHNECIDIDGLRRINAAKSSTTEPSG